MAFGQSTPLSVPAAALAGAVGGELGRLLVKKLGGDETAQRVAAGLGNGLASGAVGYAVNAVGGADVTGAAVTTVQSVITGTMHATMEPGHFCFDPSAF